MMLTHTTIQLNLAHPEVQRDLADCQGMHRRVMRLFRHVNATRTVNDVLYRIDRDETVWRLLIQSTAYADVTMLPPGYALPPIRQRDDALERLQALVVGQQLPFVLLANIVKRDFALHRTRTIYDGEEQREWMRRKAHQHGFGIDESPTALLPLTIETEPTVKGVHPRGALAYDAFRISGVLTVVEPALLIDAVQHGIGKAKAYGFGLLSMATI